MLAAEQRPNRSGHPQWQPYVPLGPAKIGVGARCQFAEHTRAVLRETDRAEGRAPTQQRLEIQSVPLWRQLQRKRQTVMDQCATLCGTRKGFVFTAEATVGMQSAAFHDAASCGAGQKLLCPAATLGEQREVHRW